MCKRKSETRQAERPRRDCEGGGGAGPHDRGHTSMRPTTGRRRTEVLLYSNMMELQWSSLCPYKRCRPRNSSFTNAAMRCSRREWGSRLDGVANRDYLLSVAFGSGLTEPSAHTKWRSKCVHPVAGAATRCHKRKHARPTDHIPLRKLQGHFRMPGTQMPNFAWVMPNLWSKTHIL